LLVVAAVAALLVAVPVPDAAPVAVVVVAAPPEESELDVVAAAPVLADPDAPAALLPAAVTKIPPLTALGLVVPDAFAAFALNTSKVLPFVGRLMTPTIPD
jgi:hypothetical protein